MMFIKYAAYHLQQLGAKKQRNKERLRNSQEKEVVQNNAKEGKVSCIPLKQTLLTYYNNIVQLLIENYII